MDNGCSLDLSMQYVAAAAWVDGTSRSEAETRDAAS